MCKKTLTETSLNSLLSRDTFREKVFDRDGGKCVYCGEPAVDAHHIIDRSLWDNGGFYLDNGVSLCETHHMMAETTEISCAELRSKAKIENVLLPEHFYFDEEYDHWGNIIKPTGARIAGELYHKESVRDTIRKSGNLEKFVPYVKFPRTYHLPSSPGLQNDDKRHEDVKVFNGLDVVVTAKLDGENTSCYKNYVHARSTDSKNHTSRSWIKAFHSQWKHDIPEGWRITGENLYAEHSIRYVHLESYFYVFGVWNEYNVCLSWEDTKEYVALLNLTTVPLIYKGIFDEGSIQESFKSFCDKSKDPVEGYVVRSSGEIPYGMYRKFVAKWVRANHVQTDQHWMQIPVVKNGLC